MPPTAIRDFKSGTLVSYLLIGIAILILITFGVFGLYRSAYFGFDFSTFHVAGRLLLEGKDPWLALASSESVFSYPPHVLLPCVLYALLPHSFAIYVNTGFNLASIGCFIFLLNRWFLAIESHRKLTFAQGACLALLFGNPFINHSIYQGQVMLQCVAAVFLSWHFLKSEKRILSGLLLGLATIKPQAALLYIVWLLLAGELGVIFIGGLTSIVLMLPGLFVLGPKQVFVSWISTMDSYFTFATNIPGSDYVIGFESLLAACGYPGVTLWPVAFVSLLVLFAFRSQLNNTFIVCAFGAISVTFVYGHAADYVAVLPLWVYFCYLAMSSKKVVNIASFALISSVFFFPQRFLRELDAPILHHLPTLMVPLAAFFTVVFLRSEKRCIEES